MTASISHISRALCRDGRSLGLPHLALRGRKFGATLEALPRPRHDHALEVGCGNGELARRSRPRCDAYTGVDAVERALAAALVAVPGAVRLRTFLPSRGPRARMT